jgi:hypothetical protein
MEDTVAALFELATARSAGIGAMLRGCSDDGSDSSEKIVAHFDQKPPATLRYVAVGRSSRSLPLLSGGASG